MKRIKASKRILAVLLSLTMVMVMSNMTVSAAEITQTETVVETVTETQDEVLTIEEGSLEEENQETKEEEKSEASEEDVMRLIHSIGLYKNKSRNIINLAKELVKRFDGEVPSKREELESLPGVGRKTANVVLSNCFDYPAFAVDTHVSRVSKRLMIARKDDDVLTIEKKLMKFFPRNCWSRLHHQFIFFGRYKCKAKNPECTDCPFRDSCRKD